MKERKIRESRKKGKIKERMKKTANTSTTIIIQTPVKVMRKFYKMGIFTLRLFYYAKSMEWYYFF